MKRKNKSNLKVTVDRTSGGNVDWSTASRVNFANLKPSSTTISLRMADSMLNDIKLLANRRDVPYQSLIKMILADGIREMK